MKQKVTAEVLSQINPAPGIYDMRLRTELAGQAHAGQFLGVYPRDKSTLLPRPISICEVNGDRTALRIVYRIAGKGTAEFAGYRAGETVDILGPLGNGFPIEAAAGKRVFLMGGGIGIPPILQLAKELNRVTARENIRIIAGYRDAQTFLTEDLGQYGRLYLATEDGSIGTRGNVCDVIRACGLETDVIYACGPMPMLRAIKGYALEADVPAYLSLEEHMACGVGACLGCVVKTKEKDPHSHVNNARICTDGPVFEARTVEI